MLNISSWSCTELIILRSDHRDREREREREGERIVGRERCSSVSYRNISHALFILFIFVDRKHCTCLLMMKMCATASQLFGSSHPFDGIAVFAACVKLLLHFKKYKCLPFKPT